MKNTGTVIIILLLLSGLLSCRAAQEFGMASKLSEELPSGGAQREARQAEAPEPQTGETQDMIKQESIGFDKVSGEDGTGLDQNAAQVKGRTVPEERKKVYSGYAQLLVDNTEEVKNNITRIADRSGGYVESVYENTVEIRVPAGDFDAIFEEILGLGTVSNKSVETFDVTEFYADLKTRLTIAEKTRERLYVLLDRTADVNERLKILREIRRLTEQIERIKITFDLLENQIAFSRITVELVSRFEEESYTIGKIPFPWMAGLNPLYAGIDRYRDSFQPALGDEFAVFAREKIFRAESADGVRVRLGTVENDPSGDSVFWQKALLFHVRPLYSSAEEKDLGSFKAVLFKSKDREPYAYLVGVKAAGNNLHIAEVFFPSWDVYNANIESVMKAFGTTPGK